MAGRPIHTFDVVRTEQLTPHMIRLVLGGAGFDTFTPNDFTDAYVKIVIVDPDIDVAGLAQPLTLDSFSSLPPEKRPTVRTYTVRHVDADRRELCIDFVVHGEQVGVDLRLLAARAHRGDLPPVEGRTGQGRGTGRRVTVGLAR